MCASFYDDRLRQMSMTKCRAFVFAAGAACVLSAIFAGVWLSNAGAADEIALETRINPNTAPAASLMRLPNIGPKRARAIVEYRRAVGGPKPAFEKADDLARIKGIGPATVEGVRRWLCFD
jgi:competence protein ComEA